MNGQGIDADHSLTSLIQKYNVGDRVTLRVFREGKEMDVKVILEEKK